MLERVRIVLVEPSHPGNIGATARAMKTMGLSRLVLVAPQEFPSSAAIARAAGADDILEKAQVVSSLQAGLAEVDWVIGASARGRTLARQCYHPRSCSEAIAQKTGRQVAIVFGRESSGLTNEELALCHDQVSIPSNPNYGSLNLAAAVQVVAYELRMAFLSDAKIESGQKVPLHKQDPLATADQVAGFYQHLQQTLTAIGFMDPKQPKRLMERLQLLFNRSELTVTELNILRGVLSAVDQRVG